MYETIWEGLLPYGWVVWSWIGACPLSLSFPTGRHWNFGLHFITFPNFWLNVKTFVRLHRLSFVHGKWRDTNGINMEKRLCSQNVKKRSCTGLGCMIPYLLTLLTPSQKRLKHKCNDFLYTSGCKQTVLCMALTCNKVSIY